MKIEASRRLKRAQRLGVGYFILFILFAGCLCSPPATGATPASPPVHVNRTLPKLDPLKTTLKFSAIPTEEELFRARVFVEPLVLVGGKPTANQNSDLAAALLTDLGLEYHDTAHYSLALDARGKAWPHATDATDATASEPGLSYTALFLFPGHSDCHALRNQTKRL